MPTEPAKIGEWYDSLSESYDPLYGAEQSEKHGRVCEILKGHRFRILIDAGCGTGSLLAKAKDNYHYALGVDLSLKMLTRARANTESEVCDFVRADCSAMPLRPRISDCTLSISVVDGSYEPQRIIRELRRITRTGGTLISSVIHPLKGAPRVGSVGLGRKAWASSKETVHVCHL